MPNNEIISRGAHRLSGRLIAVPSRGDLQKEPLSEQPFSRAMAIDFPSMPDTLDLIRSAEYAVSPSPFIPDGLHVYKNTRPMEVPFSFKLHAFDQQYCKEGALTLLKIASRLHAFTLPIITDSRAVVNIGDGKLENATDKKPGVKTGEKTDPEVQFEADGQVKAAFQDSKNSMFPPVTAFLHLIFAGHDQPGVSCIGYVKDVAVKLCGPWLAGPNRTYNLPSKAEYSFTFVHRPSHGNLLGAKETTYVGANRGQVSAAADDVKAKLYNTWNLAYAPGYRGFNDMEN